MDLHVKRLVPLVCGIAFACTPAEDRVTDAPTVVDSAGVAIITNGGAAAEWQLAGGEGRLSPWRLTGIGAPVRGG